MLAPTQTPLSFNLAYVPKPAGVVFPKDPIDVVEAVRDARRRGLRVAAQATGHNVEAHGDLAGALLVDVRAMQDVAIDPGAQRVRVGAGVKWERVAPLLSEHGLAGLHGSSPDVGIAGYSLGGGMGWLARRYGLQANSVTAIELVTADGRFVRADAETEPDLFWALRGGNCNFGVVTALEFAVYPVEELYAGVLFFEVERVAEVLHAWTTMLPSAPDELMTWAAALHFPDEPDVPEPMRGASYAVVYGAYLGGEADGRELLRPVRELGPALDTFAMAPPAVLVDMAMDPPEPLPYRSAHQMLSDLPASAIEDLAPAAGPGSALALVQFRHLGGALSRAEPHAGARATLPGAVSLYTAGVVTDDWAGAAVHRALDTVERAVLPYRAGDYPNFVERPADASGFFDGETWRRLREVKAAYDPDDLFRGNHHIPPA